MRQTWFGTSLAGPERMSTVDQLNAQLDKLAAFDPGPYPVLSLYLDLRPNQRGRDQFEPFLRKELAERLRTYATGGPERDSLEKDAARIRQYVSEVDPALNGLVIFACSGADFMETIHLVAPVSQNRLYISDQPHLYPLARLLDEYPRYLALVADTHSARIFVFAINTVEQEDRIENPKTVRHKMGGWSQARYQRHADNYHLQHAKEVVEAIARIAREESIDKIVLSGDEVILPLLRKHLQKDIAEKIVDVIKLDVRTPERQVLDVTLAALREKDAESDRERVDQLMDAYRSNGLACVGIEATRRAFELGQVDEVLLPAIGKNPEAESAAEELVLEAYRTSAKTRFIEDASLLEPIGGVGAFLRFKL
jgi:peptide subunit release factor 1 (eRF1)